MRLIDADALIDEVRSIWKAGSLDEYKSAAWKYALADTVILVLNVIARMLPIDAEPVRHGEWFDKGSLSCRCSKCGCKNTRESAYCPNCGAKMRCDVETK